MKILNAFSVNMLSGLPALVEFTEVSLSEAAKLARSAESAIGHADTAAVFSTVLGVPLSTNRATVTLQKGDEALVGQYRGPRLPEGSTTLPDDATIQWIVVSVA